MQNVWVWGCGCLVTSDLQVRVAVESRSIAPNARLLRPHISNHADRLIFIGSTISGWVTLWNGKRGTSRVFGRASELFDQVSGLGTSLDLSSSLATVDSHRNVLREALYRSHASHRARASRTRATCPRASGLSVSFCPSWADFCHVIVLFACHLSLRASPVWLGCVLEHVAGPWEAPAYSLLLEHVVLPLGAPAWPLLLDQSVSSGRHLLFVRMPPLT